MFLAIGCSSVATGGGVVNSGVGGNSGGSNSGVGGNSGGSNSGVSSTSKNHPSLHTISITLQNSLS